MAEISAQLVKQLREKTGAGMMECKSALVEAKGDLGEAEVVLRKRGLASAAKKAARSTRQGLVGVQIAAALGAAVVAIDVDQSKLELAASHGAGLTLNSSAMTEKDVKAAVRGFAKQSGRRAIGLKIFETSGTAGGQQTAFGLLDFGGHLAVVGFTSKKIELRLSNLMAFDATARGNWGCPPDQYPAALDLVLQGKVAVAPYVVEHPLDDAPAVFDAVVRHAIDRRVILKPAWE